MILSLTAFSLDLTAAQFMTGSIVPYGCKIMENGIKKHKRTPEKQGFFYFLFIYKYESG